MATTKTVPVTKSKPAAAPSGLTLDEISKQLQAAQAELEEQQRKAEERMELLKQKQRELLINQVADLKAEIVKEWESLKSKADQVHIADPNWLAPWTPPPVVEKSFDDYHKPILDFIGEESKTPKEIEAKFNIGVGNVNNWLKKLVKMNELVAVLPPGAKRGATYRKTPQPTPELPMKG